MINILKFTSLMFLASWGLSACGSIEDTLPTDDVYLFSSFRGNGEDGLHLAYSHDALQWQTLNNDQSVLRPNVGGSLMRDPCIILGPDNVFHMVWTTGWQDKGIGIAHSTDLINWSEQQYIPVMAHFPTARNAWAPEIIWDETSQHYLIYWASTLAGQYPATEKTADKGWDHRIYATSTQDFVSYTPSELFYQPDFNVIDATIVEDQGTYIMLVKDETRYPPAKNLHVARAADISGPWQFNTEPFTPAESWVEGPTILATDKGYYVYFDQYTEHRYGAMHTNDFVHWRDVSDKLHMPAGSRHGSVLRISNDQFKALSVFR